MVEMFKPMNWSGNKIVQDRRGVLKYFWQKRYMWDVLEMSKSLFTTVERN